MLVVNWHQTSQLFQAIYSKHLEEKFGSINWSTNDWKLGILK